jgi:hypothetical protein
MGDARLTEFALEVPIRIAPAPIVMSGSASNHPFEFGVFETVPRIRSAGYAGAAPGGARARRW